MRKKDTELNIAYVALLVLLVVSIGAYAAWPQSALDNPVRFVFHNIGGKVIFDHKGHYAESGYGYGCKECHHDLEKEGQRPASCSECHKNEPGDAPKRSDALHKQCIDCHKDAGGPKDCAQCHIR